MDNESPHWNFFSNDESQRLQDMDAVCANLREANSKLVTKVSDLEGCSRRWRLGLPESIESGPPSQFFSELLIEVFGKDLPTPPETDRAHHSLTALDI